MFFRAGVNILCSDKTGTLTKNKLEIQEDTPTYEPNLTQIDLLKQAALASKWDSPPRDMLDMAVLQSHLWYPGLQQATADYLAKNPGCTQGQKDEWYLPISFLLFPLP